MNFSSPYFPVFEQTAEIYRVNLDSYSEYEIMQTRKKTPYSDVLKVVLKLLINLH